MAVLDTIRPPAEARRPAELDWMIEELRVSLWAQSLGTAVPVSVERIRRLVVAASS
jgi:ATP-dependent helicase HrpA